MKKIVLVTLLGGIALAVFLFLRGGSATAPPGAALGAVASVTTPAAVPGVPQAPSQPVNAAPAPVSAAPGLPPTPGDGDACRRLADLCSTSDQRVDPDQCQRDLDDARKIAGPGNVERSARCVADARTCAAAMGCVQGGVGMGALGEYLKGFGAALSH